MTSIEDISYKFFNLFVDNVLNESDIDVAISNLSTFIGPDFYDASSASFGTSSLASLLINRPHGSTFRVIYTLADDDKLAFHWQQLDSKDSIIKSGIDIFRFSFFMEKDNHTAQISERWSYSD